MFKTDLPIREILPELAARCDAEQIVLLQAPPGSGKSTIVPLALLERSWLSEKKILLLQPRRLAARSLAIRMSELLGEEPGQTVGYRVRFETRVSARTRIEVVTEGILTRMLQEDPELAGIGLVIFDEFHERSIHADLALTLTRESQAALRPDLRLLIMSATLGTDDLEKRLDASVVRGSGTPFPVEIRYLAEDPKPPVWEAAVRETVRVAEEPGGDVLVFLPGVEEIRRSAEALAARSKGAEIHSLYGDLPYDRQRAALLPSKSWTRKIILSTPIAETSLTIEGVTVVIDAGLARIPRFDPSSGLSRLATERISLDAADQRAGRAGRLAPGICVRLWSQHTQRTLRKQRTPEILEADLAPLVLEAAVWGVRDRLGLRWLDAPPEPNWKQAVELLVLLGALDGNGVLTAAGKSMARTAAHPRLARMFVAAGEMNKTALACDVAALLEERDIFARERENADLEDRIEALRASRRGVRGVNDAGRVRRVADEWCRRLGTPPEKGPVREGEAGELLLFAYPERVAKRRTDGGARYLLANGAGAMLAGAQSLAKSEYLVIAQMQVRTGDGKIFLATPVDAAAVRKHFADRIVRDQALSWDGSEKAVRAESTERFGALVLSTRPVEADGTAVSAVLIENLLLEGGVSRLGWGDADRQLQGRIRFARLAFPELHIPDCSDEALNAELAEFLGPFIGTTRKLSRLQELSVSEMLRSRIGWESARQVDRLCPPTMPTPDGRSHEIDYTPADSPVLGATVQELFGWRETPKILEGRVVLTLHILSPARRAMQVTKDLAGFWKNTYFDVRKDLRGRYPKHPWPDDPVNEPPRTRRRK